MDTLALCWRADELAELRLRQVNKKVERDVDALRETVVSTCTRALISRWIVCIFVNGACTRSRSRSPRSAPFPGRRQPGPPRSS